MERLWIVLGALAGFGAVAMAAAGAHALGGLPPPAAAAVRSATEMQGWHALALLAVGLWVRLPDGSAAAVSRVAPGRTGRLGAGRLGLANLAGAAFTLGLLLFCGALYLHGLAGVRLGPVAPIGGTLLMLGWLLFGASALRAR